MPLVQNVLNSHAVGFGMSVRNEWFEADYSGVACLQEDEKLKFDAAEAKRAYYQSLYDSGLITKNQILTGLDMPENTDPSFNELKDETETDTGGNQETETTTGETDQTETND